MKANSETQAPYIVATPPASPPSNDDAVIRQALGILETRLKKPLGLMSTPSDVKAFCRLNLGGRQHEVFGVLFLDVQNRLIAFDEMFRGTLTQTSVYPREVVMAALAHNCAAVVLTHNHPSGSVHPSRADETLTQTLKAALSLVDVRILDHIIVSAVDALSMAERGLI